MLKELLSIFRGDDPLAAMGRNVVEMLRLAEDLTHRAGDIYFAEANITSEDRTEVYRQDVRINKLERVIRKQVIAHLAVQGPASRVPYCLLIMNIVKDVERIGDYAKNLAEVRELQTDALPEGEFLDELKEIRREAEETFALTGGVFQKSDHESAVTLIRGGRDLNQRCEVLIQRIARGSQNARVTTAFVLGTRYYKRISAHLLNVLSGVVMPLHKLDYFDEKEIAEAPDADD